MKKSALKLLLLQIRDKPQVREEEWQSFVNFAGLQPHQLEVLNVFDEPSFSADRVDEYDALIVGGASEASVLEPDTYPFVDACVAMLKHCCDIKKPVFASCFGFQLAVLALNGRIVRDLQGFEIGTVPITLTPKAQQDPVLRYAPDPFLAVSVHRERAPELPERCELLAYTEKCPHAFKVRNLPFWAFQFHPEVDKKTLVERLTVFADQYTEDAAHLQDVIENAKETPESNQLVARFIDAIMA